MRRALALLFVPALALAAPTADLVLHDCATVHVAPTEPVQIRVDVVIDDGIIVTVAPHAPHPAGAPTLDCGGGTVTAGFQNSHVHFMPQAFAGVAARRAEDLEIALRTMFGRYGFTTVVDTGSMIEDTTALRARIESGEVRGPRIFTAGLPLYPPDGIPIYLRDLPPDVLARMPQPASAAAAVAVVEANQAAGADVVKLFAGAVMGGGAIKPMPVDIARAAAAEAHRRGMIVFAHPSNNVGANVAVDAGVDVLAHTNSEGWDEALIGRLIEKRMALVPTLKLWTFEAARQGASPTDTEALVAGGVSQLAAFAKAGGQVLFGTDVGYMTDSDPADEYGLMARAGLSPEDILASLTVNPAQRFGEADRRGRVAPGHAADLVVFDGKPFSRVRQTIRGGRVIFDATRLPAP